MEGSSGLIVAFVVALWAAYFVPLVLRRHDEASKNSSLDHEGAQRRVVEPRRAVVAAEESLVTRPAAPAPKAPTETSPAVDRTSPAVDRQPARPTREAARIAARRRRHVLLTLIAVLAVLAGLAVARLVPAWTPAIGAGLIVAWLVLCRVMVRQERGIAGTGGGPLRSAGRAVWRVARGVAGLLGGIGRRLGGAVSTRRPGPVAPVAAAGDEELTVVVSHQVEEHDPDHRHVMETDAPLAADALDEQLQIAVPSVSASTGEPLWDPLPVTVPTYVTKPRAGRTVRTIDFSQPGTWTSGHVEGEQTELPVDTRDDGDDTGTERHAVGH